MRKPKLTTVRRVKHDQADEALFALEVWALNARAGEKAATMDKGIELVKNLVIKTATLNRLISADKGSKVTKS